MSSEVRLTALDAAVTAGASVNALILRMDAPLMSFGGVVVDARHDTLRYPIRSMLTGLMANAMGYDRTEVARLDALQESFEFASRWDVTPVLLRDYQVADLGSYKMSRKAWTSKLTLEGRGGSAADAKHPLEKFYWSDGVLLAAVRFADTALASAAAAALLRPARPLFYGRKCCVPSSPLGHLAGTADSALSALLAAPVLAEDAMRNGHAGEVTVRKEVDCCVQALPSGSGPRQDVWVPRRLDHASRTHVDQEHRARSFFDVEVQPALA